MPTNEVAIAPANVITPGWTDTPGERAHSPNERYPVEDFYAAVRTGIALFEG